MDMKDAMKFDVALEIMAAMVGKRIARLSKIENDAHYVNEVKQIKIELSKLRIEKRVLYRQEKIIMQKVLEIYGKEIAMQFNESMK